METLVDFDSQIIHAIESGDLPVAMACHQEPMATCSTPLLQEVEGGLLRG